MTPRWHKLRFRLDHRWAPRQMSAYLDSELATSSTTRFDNHTVACPECRAVLADLRHMLALLQRAPAPEPLAGAPVIAGVVLRRLNDPAGG
jgi:anti-sigma factor RsiW